MEKESMEDLENTLEKLRIAFEEERIRYEGENSIWWDSLTLEEQEHAFYAVVKRIYQSEIVDQGSFRWALYDVFNFGPEMYSRAMNCGYLELHNAINVEPKKV